MKIKHSNNISIISFICFFFLGCSSTQLIEISKDDQLNNLLTDIGYTELSVNASENTKKLILKSLIKLDSKIKITFVEEINNDTLVVTDNFLNQKFTYYCKSANSYLEEKTKQDIFATKQENKIFVFYVDKFLPEIEIFKKNYPEVNVFKLEDNYDELIKETFELSGSYSRSNLLDRLIQEEEVNFVPRPRKDIKKIYIVSEYDQAKNFIPSLRFNYILDREIYASSRAIIKIDDRKKLLDFSNLLLTVPNSFTEENNSSNLDELSKISFLQDLIIVSAFKKNNGKSQTILGKFGNIRYSQSTCSDIDLNLVRIDAQGKFNLL